MGRVWKKPPGAFKEFVKAPGAFKEFGKDPGGFLGAF
jgi:hypothetical protein